MNCFKMLVSIIIPVFNTAPYLREALDSAINQTYKNVEIIIINDGSTDGSFEIIEEYQQKDERIRAISQGNKGLSAARNVALGQIKGEVYAFLDSDDAYDYCFVEKMVRAMEANDADLVICNRCICPTTKSMTDKTDDIELRIKEGIYSHNNALRLFGYQIPNNSVWNKLYRYDRFGDLRFVEGHVHEDGIYTFQVLQRCNTVYYLEDVLYYYRRRPGSLTNSGSIQAYYDWLLSLTRIETMIKENVPKVFTDEEFRSRCAQRLDRLIGFYILMIRDRGDPVISDLKLKKQIVDLGRVVGIGDLSIRRRITYYMIRFLPWMLKVIVSHREK